MSGIGASPRTDERAAAIKRQAAEWLERSDRPDWSKDDQRELDAWLSASTVNFLAYQRVAMAWGRAERLVALERQYDVLQKQASRPAATTAVLLPQAEVTL